MSYYNGTAYTFTWEGRRLVGAVKGTKTMSFTYNDDGIRTSKTVNGVTHTYYLNGNLIMAEQWEDKLLVYLYDVSGSPIGMMYRTESYSEGSWDTFWYEKNLFGDIIAVYNESGSEIISYTYKTAWGEHSTISYNLSSNEGAQYNPFRYRGYYYDTDLGMYYLQSRYYDSAICRFINADGYVSTGQGVIGNNMFAYCGNNPVNRVDTTGDFWIVIVAAVIAVVCVNVYKVAKSEITVAVNNTEPMEEDFYYYDNPKAPTYNMGTDEKIAYIRRVRLENDTIATNWSEADMLREMEYHETGYKIAVFFGSNEHKEGSIAYRLRHVEFEEKQNFTTYARRFIGNLLPWG